MHGIPPPPAPCHLDSCSLNAAAFQLDVYGSAVSDRFEHVLQPRHRLALTKVHLLEVRPRSARNRSTMNGVVVMDYDDTISREMGIELYGISGQFQRPCKARHGVFTTFAWCAAVRHALQAVAGHVHGRLSYPWCNDPARL